MAQKSKCGEIHWHTSEGSCGVLYEDHRTRREYEYECVPADIIEHAGHLFKNDRYKEAFNMLKPYAVTEEE